MSVASEITRINQNIASAYVACSDKGAAIPENQNSNNLAITIRSIPNAYIDEIASGSLVSINSSIEQISVERAFANQPSLTTVNLPNCVSISDYAFSECTNLTSISLDSIERLTVGEFYNCSNLVSVYAPNLKYLNDHTAYQGWAGPFSYCSSLADVNFPELLAIGSSALSNTSIIHINFPKLYYIHGQSAFWSCAALIRAEFPALTTVYWDRTFHGCTSLTSIVFGQRVNVTNTDFGWRSSNTIPDQTIFYVQNSDLSWYQSDSNWSYYYTAGRIKSIDELPPM